MLNLLLIKKVCIMNIVVFVFMIMSIWLVMVNLDDSFEKVKVCFDEYNIYYLLVVNYK